MAENEIRSFLSSRRARITPDQVGLPNSGRRRVQGLRREEVALLAGISAEYYIQLERGSVRGVSDDVLDALARTLRLDDVERLHLLDLVHIAKQRAEPRGRERPQRVRPTVQRVLDTITEAPAFVRNGRLDILSANMLGYALYADAFAVPTRPVNLARFVFLNPAARTFYRNWDDIADSGAGSLRAQAGRDPHDRGLTELVEELSTSSEDFRVRWASHDVRLYASGTQEFHHPFVGDLTLRYEALELTADVDLTMIVYAADAGSPSQDALDSLAARSAGKAKRAERNVPSA